MTSDSPERAASHEALPALGQGASSPPLHGADLASASRRYGIPVDQWLDLSTGINPRMYPPAAVDAECYRELPLDDSELRTAAQRYCGAEVAPVMAAGSQVLIQWLPLVRTQFTSRRNRIGVPAIGYSEHAFRWRWAGHEIVHYDPRDAAAIDALLARGDIDVLIAINAHNPLGLLVEPARLLAWRERLAARGGWLIVDEAFIDPTPQYSVAAQAQLPGLIVLRSLGKFFGLAGIRCGYAFCAEEITAALRIAVGPWSLSGPALRSAAAALGDAGWQDAMRAELPQLSAVNADLLRRAEWARDKTILRHALFNSIELEPALAVAIEDRFARSGVRIRRVEIDAACSLLRFGLADPAQVVQWSRFRAVLSA